MGGWLGYLGGRTLLWLEAGKIVRTLEVNGAGLIGVDFVDHVLQFGVGGMLAKGAHDGAELDSRDVAITVFVLRTNTNVREDD